MTYRELDEARQVFGLGARASLREIKGRHRELARRHHPDTGGEEDPATMQRINAAYRILMEYVSEYRFSFDEEEFYEQNPEEGLRRQFMNDPVWGNG